MVRNNSHQNPGTSEIEHAKPSRSSSRSFTTITDESKTNSQSNIDDEVIRTMENFNQENVDCCPSSLTTLQNESTRLHDNSEVMLTSCVDSGIEAGIVNTISVESELGTACLGPSSSSTLISHAGII